ncbi:hypothetical protein EDB19DRAFT_226066 [Suillus lakei]|nr:hypothetical protein EDB19DRAFT_226066 [Suillus lakei]
MNSGSGPYGRSTCFAEYSVPAHMSFNPCFFTIFEIIEKGPRKCQSDVALCGVWGDMGSRGGGVSIHFTSSIGILYNVSPSESAVQTTSNSSPATLNPQGTLFAPTKSYVDAYDPARLPFCAKDASNPCLGQKIPVLSGKEDRLVPWVASVEFVQGRARGVRKVVLEEGAGHRVWQWEAGLSVREWCEVVRMLLFPWERVGRSRIEESSIGGVRYDMHKMWYNCLIGNNLE